MLLSAHQSAVQDAVLQRCFAVEPITAVACSLDGIYCAGGGQSGNIYVWEVPSGRLLRSWPAHYKVRLEQGHRAAFVSSIELQTPSAICLRCSTCTNVRAALIAHSGYQQYLPIVCPTHATIAVLCTGCGCAEVLRQWRSASQRRRGHSRVSMAPHGLARCLSLPESRPGASDLPQLVSHLRNACACLAS